MSKDQGVEEVSYRDCLIILEKAHGKKLWSYEVIDVAGGDAVAANAAPQPFKLALTEAKAGVDRRGTVK